MMRVDCRLMVDVPEVGETRLADVYALGAQKCRGMLAERTVDGGANRLQVRAEGALIANM